MPAFKKQIDLYLWDAELTRGKMIFLSGPRQVGKTTYAKSLLGKERPGAYFNWDDPAVRKAYAADSHFFAKSLTPGRERLVIFDEIHKRRQWKNILKGIYDTADETHRILVTGSARLELFRKAGDSLVGRYVHFHLLPLSVSEVQGKKLDALWLCAPDDWKQPALGLSRCLTSAAGTGEKRSAYQALFKFGGFPEPFFKQSERSLFKWKEDYLSLLLTEDLRDLTNIRAVDTVEKMVALLPPRVGSPLSIASLSRDLETTFATVKNHLYQLKKLWLLFTLRPWTGRLHRAVKKEEKCYFTNWIYAGDDAKVFENFIAASLIRACTVWTDLAFGKAELWFVRNFDGSEVDFLITLNGAPMLLVEAKLSDAKIPASARNFSRRLNVPLVQVVHRPGIFLKEPGGHFVVSAERFLGILP